MARKVLHSAKFVTAVSPDLRNRIQYISSSKIDVIPNPLGQSFIDASVCNTIRTPDANPRVISVINGWGHLKNATTALTAFKIIRSRIPGATFHVFGYDFHADGPAADWAAQQGLADGVVFNGPVSHSVLIAALKEATVMVHPSRSEACPMGIAEALSCGLPVVGGSQSGGVPWMIGEAGILVDINEAECIGDAVLQLLSNHDRYKKCVVAAKLRVREFKPELIAKQYLSKYNVVCNVITSPMNVIISNS
jgi:glycosyltransferase involved in cell wall biosynthesis